MKIEGRKSSTVQKHFKEKKAGKRRERVRETDRVQEGEPHILETYIYTFDRQYHRYSYHRLLLKVGILIFVAVLIHCGKIESIAVMLTAPY